MTHLNDAVAKGDLPAVRNLIETQRYNPNYTGFTGWNDTPITVAAKFGQRKVMEYLIQKGADVNQKGYWGFTASAIETALMVGKTQTVVTLLVNNATLPTELHKTDIANQYLLKAASTNDSWSIEKILTYTEADINTHGDFMMHTPLHKAVMNDGLDATVKLLEMGAKINAVDLNGWTALHYAASNSDTQFAKLLIEKGAKVNAVDLNDRTPLYAAAMSGEEELVNLLVKSGGKINHTDNDGISVLDLAIINDDADMIRCLVSNGSKISAGIDNTTPLEHAAELGKLQAIEALIQLGSSINHKNSQGKTALELAFNANEIGAVNILKMYGAEVPKYVQVKLDKIKPVDADHVLPGDNVVTPTYSSDKAPGASKVDSYHNNNYNDGEAIYAKPIGPMLGNPENHPENLLGGY